MSNRKKNKPTKGSPSHYFQLFCRNNGLKFFSQIELNHLIEYSKTDFEFIYNYLVTEDIIPDIQTKISISRSPELSSSVNLSITDFKNIVSGKIEKPDFSQIEHGFFQPVTPGQTLKPKSLVPHSKPVFSNKKRTPKAKLKEKPSSSVLYSFKADIENLEALKQLASDEDRSVSSLIRIAIKQYLQRNS